MHVIYFIDANELFLIPDNYETWSTDNSLCGTWLLRSHVLVIVFHYLRVTEDAKNLPEKIVKYNLKTRFNIRQKMGLTSYIEMDDQSFMYYFHKQNMLRKFEMPLGKIHLKVELQQFRVLIVSFLHKIKEIGQIS